MQRGREQIDRDIAETEERLRILREERDAIPRQRNGAIVSDFDAGMSFREISKARGLSYNTVQSVCFRAGRTLGGRTAIRRRLRGGQVDQSVSP
jgi:DNA-directed RNA polymerase specialized sigma24 family protein